jgi:hypothetical protein
MNRNSTKAKGLTGNFSPKRKNKFFLDIKFNPEILQ